MRIAFYAPLKAPTHTTPSGDRRMGRLLMAALEAGGHQVALASDFRSFDGRGEAQVQARIAAAGRAEADNILATYRAAPPQARPDAWFSYHLYYKAPDHLGPAIARELDIPYVVAEPSYAPKRAGGPWDDGHRLVGAALREAGAALCLTRHDMACVAPLLAEKKRLFHLPPFLDAAPYLASGSERSEQRRALSKRFDIDPNKRWLIAVGMMRPGDKAESYRRLAAALHKLEGDDWRLLTVGDGAARAEVEALYSDFARGRISHLGAIAPADMPATLAAADLFVWPAAGEAYGMAILEAQASGLPVIAGDLRGVPEVVLDGLSALLVPENDAARFAGAVRRLIDDTGLRRRMADAARHFVQNERSIARAGGILNQALSLATTGQRSLP